MTFDLPERPQNQSPSHENYSLHSELAQKDIQQIVRSLKESEPVMNQKGFLMEILSENIDTSPGELQKPSMLQVIVKDEKSAESKSPFILRNPSLRLEIDPGLNQVSVLSKPYIGIGSGPTRFIKDYFDQEAPQRLMAVKNFVEEFLATTIQNSVPA